MYITAASTISHQPTFRNPGFSRKLADLPPSSSLITPDYSAFIPAMDRRRMSEVIRMAIACSKDCLEQAGLKQPDGIVVGTSMGCSVNTKNFLEKVWESGDGPLAPTSFIASTHNTIAGQVSLMLKNHGYNMTHTQNSLSFEQALTDGILCLHEGSNHMLVGGADEEEETIYNMRERLGDPQLHLTCGASFFILSNQSVPHAIRLSSVQTHGLTKNKADMIQDFLRSNDQDIEETDLVLYTSLQKHVREELKTIFGNKKLIDYLPLSGTWYTNSAFAMHYAVDLLKSQSGIAENPVRNILVLNNLIPENLGLILLTSE